MIRRMTDRKRRMPPALRDTREWQGHTWVWVIVMPQLYLQQFECIEIKGDLFSVRNFYWRRAGYPRRDVFFTKPEAEIELNRRKVVAALAPCP